MLGGGGGAGSESSGSFESAANSKGIGRPARIERATTMRVEITYVPQRSFRTALISSAEPNTSSHPRDSSIFWYVDGRITLSANGVAYLQLPSLIIFLELS
jgi:hypothetical protein